MYKAKEDILWIKKGQIVEDKDMEENWKVSTHFEKVGKDVKSKTDVKITIPKGIKTKVIDLVDDLKDDGKRNYSNRKAKKKVK